MTIYSQTRYPTSAANVASGSGDVDWTDPLNVCVSDNTNTRVYNGDDYAKYSNYLKTYGHNFNIPTYAVIVGYLVEIEKLATKNSTTQYVIDQRVQLNLNDITSSNKGTQSAKWPTTEATSSYGGSTDLWELTLSPSDINQYNFGVSFDVLVDNYPASEITYAYVDSIKITVYYEVPSPTPPTNLTRSSYDATESAVFAWTYAPAFTGDTQSAYNLSIIDVSNGSTVYASGKVTSATSSKTLSANTLTNGKQYQWKVLVYDSLDRVTSYSSLATFYTSAKPVVAITFPATNGVTVTATPLTAMWTYTDAESGAQSAYQAVLQDGVGVAIEDTGKVSAAGLSKTFTNTLVNNTSYKVQVTVWDNRGVASVSVTRTFTVAFTPPATPTFTKSSNSERGSITLVITNPTPGVGQPAVTINNIYRKKSTESTYIKIASVAINSTYEDFTSAPGTTYNYYVQAIGDNAAYADSTVQNASVSISKPQLALTSDYSRYLDLDYNTKRSENHNYNKTMMKFTGRSAPVAEFEDQINVEIALSIIISSELALQALIDLVETKGTMLYRNPQGGKEFVTIGSLDVVDNITYYTVSFALERTSYSEVI